MAEAMVETIKTFIWSRTRQRELTGAIEFREETRQVEGPREDLRTRMSSRWEAREGVREEVIV